MSLLYTQWNVPVFDVNEDGTCNECLPLRDDDGNLVLDVDGNTVNSDIPAIKDKVLLWEMFAFILLGF